METPTTSKTNAKIICTNQQNRTLWLKKFGFEDLLVRLQKSKTAVSESSESILGVLYNDFKKVVKEAQIELDVIVGEIDFVTAFTTTSKQNQPLKIN